LLHLSEGDPDTLGVSTPGESTLQRLEGVAGEQGLADLLRPLLCRALSGTICSPARDAARSFARERERCRKSGEASADGGAESLRTESLLRFTRRSATS
jgi:hypothetical protein